MGMGKIDADGVVIVALHVQFVHSTPFPSASLHRAVVRSFVLTIDSSQPAQTPNRPASGDSDRGASHHRD